MSIGSLALYWLESDNLTDREYIWGARETFLAPAHCLLILIRTSLDAHRQAGRRTEHKNFRNITVVCIVLGSERKFLLL